MNADFYCDGNLQSTKSEKSSFAFLGFFSVFVKGMLSQREVNTSVAMLYHF